MSLTMEKREDASVSFDYKKILYQTGSISALIVCFFIPIQVATYLIWPHPADVVGWFELFNRNWFIGLISMDLLYIVNSIFCALLFLALYASLEEYNKGVSMIALLLGLVSIAIYFASNKAFEMWAISQQYAVAVTEAEKISCIAAGKILLAIYKGTAFGVYYVVNGISLVLFMYLMIKSNRFGKTTAYVGMASAVLMLIPSTAGTIGITCSLLSLIPWMLFSILVVRGFGSLVKAYGTPKSVV